MGKTTIEINGKQYDARSGALLGETLTPAKQIQATHNVRHTSRVVDGFVHPSKANTTVQQSNHSKVAAKPAIKAPGKPRRSMAEIKPAKGHKPQPAQTLMRKTVKKPTVTLKPAMKVQAASEIAAAPKSTVAIPQLKKSAHNVDESRLARASAVGQSQSIKRFAKTAATAEAHALAAAAQPAKPVRGQYHASRGQYDVAARPQQRATLQQATQAQTSTSIFEAALANARSHEQPKHKPATKPHKRFAQISAGVASVLVLVGFIAYMNMSAIQLQVASMQAGFHAQLPSFKPTGYALTGGVHASNGIVSFRFQSGDSSFNVQQQTSNWDSQTLLDNVVASADTAHKTYQGSGRTVYIYGNNATWVNGGVLYSMKITGDISSQQIVNIAASM